MQSSGLVVVSPTLAESQVSMAIDDTDLQASVALKKTKVRKYIITFVILHLLHFSYYNKIHISLISNTKLSLHFVSIFRGRITYHNSILSPFQDRNEALFNLNHSVPLLKRLGLPANAVVTVNSAGHGNGSYSYLVNSSAGNQKVGGSSSRL